MKYKAICENHLYIKAYNKGKKCASENVAVFVLPDYRAAKFQKENPTKERVNRIGIAVSKKIGNAVVRSRVKRIIREGYRLTDKANNIKKGYLIVLKAKSGCEKATSNQLRSEITHALYSLDMVTRS